MKHCKVCEPKPNKFIPVEDVKNPKCSNCGRDLFGMRIFKSGKNRPLEEVLTPRQIMKEIEELEPRNIIDYIFKGSGLNQWARKHKLIK